jgi:hypothetical protein
MDSNDLNSHTMAVIMWLIVTSYSQPQINTEYVITKNIYIYASYLNGHH